MKFLHCSKGGLTRVLDKLIRIGIINYSQPMTTILDKGGNLKRKFVTEKNQLLMVRRD
jgi:hypothetical protein